MNPPHPWCVRLMACASILFACGPTSEESKKEDQAWLIVSVSTFDQESSSGILQLQAQGGMAAELRLTGGSLRDERGETATPLCLAVGDGGIRRLPFELEGATGTLTAVLLGEADSNGTGTACERSNPVPLDSACCILPHDCGCDGETGGGGGGGGGDPTTTGAAEDSSSSTADTSDDSTTDSGDSTTDTGSTGGSSGSTTDTSGDPTTNSSDSTTAASSTGGSGTTTGGTE